MRRPGEPRFTVDSALNAMRAANRPGAKRARLDRAVLRGTGWHIEQLGMERIAGDPPAHVSDRFGLQIDLVAAV